MGPAVSRGRMRTQGPSLLVPWPSWALRTLCSGISSCERRECLHPPGYKTLWFSFPIPSQTAANPGSSFCSLFPILEPEALLSLRTIFRGLCSLKRLKQRFGAVAVASGTAHAFPMRAVGPPLPGRCVRARASPSPGSLLWSMPVGAALRRRDRAGPRGARPQCTSLLPLGQSLSFQEPPSKKGPSSCFMSNGPCVPKFR